MEYSPQADADATILKQLKAKIRQLEGTGVCGGRPALSLGCPGLDTALAACGFPHNALHEVAPDSPRDEVAACGFLAVVLARLAQTKPVLWITRDGDCYPPGLLTYGLRPETVTFVRVRRDDESLWAMEEALRCTGLAGVVADLGQADMVATRRLQLAAEKSGVPGFLLRRHGRSVLNTCATRWRIGAIPSVADDGLPGVGRDAWRIELLKARGGHLGEWLVCRDGAALQDSQDDKYTASSNAIELRPSIAVVR